jgi:hypothetical protein
VPNAGVSDNCLDNFKSSCLREAYFLTNRLAYRSNTAIVFTL